ncbi:UvrD-helicase domain-containing protein [Cetobacterium somerae]|uniref:ATP-dependent helicase n=1 Tax=Cetobacterium sp. NK01 TaxID=2993530 RepID=UPI002116D0EC|nr:UvrD-helicase domain-containing protein [Cetobacterium sp. NK01]MCQ8211277.1 UvrD-helicase domain-containing protein [Cetobacterium sp. NK01]
MSILDKLNEKQREAAQKIQGPLLILAGAGSGKTRTITYRIAHMINEKGISPYKILAVTFTNKAAREMRERVELLIGDDAHKAMISTFHSFGVRLLRVYGDKLGYNANFTIYDTDDQKRVVRGIMKELVVNDKSLTEGAVVSIISKLKENGVTVSDYEKENRFDANYKIVLECYRRYNSILKENNGMDFSDILVNLHKLLEIPEVLEKLQEKFQYIMVDEYQDTNNIQYNIITKIASKYRNICVVGDENQSIYGFRGANIKNILDFEKEYKDALVVKLEENYRSTSAILTAANEVIKNNKTARDKNLWTKKPQGELITVKECLDGREEVNYIIEEIVKRKNMGKNYKEFTILYRTNAQSRLFEEGLLKYNIPYKVFGGMQFYQRAEIKDIVAYLTVINNPQDTINLNRIINVPKRKIGDKSIEKIRDYSNEMEISMFEALGKGTEIPGLTSGVKIALDELYTILNDLIDLSREGSVSEVFDELIKRIGYFSYLNASYGVEAEGRIENVEELKNSIVELEKTVDFLTLREYLENISLVSATDELEGEADYIKLMTIHNSKGLEFPVVFLTGVEDDIFPGSKKVLFNPEELEEERRLCYVAITRAEEKLYISHAKSRFVYGEFLTKIKSRFIEELPEEVLERVEKPSETLPKSRISSETKKITGFKNIIDAEDLKKMKNISNSPFAMGEKVIHTKFGLGKVIEISEKKIGVQFVDGKKDIAIVLATKFLTKA